MAGVAFSPAAKRLANVRQSSSAAPSEPIALGPSGGFVKLDTAKLDNLVDLVGELVIAQSMVVQNPDVQMINSLQLVRCLRQLSRITTELQRNAMSLRMVPIRGMFHKMNRLVRDLATQQQKHVQLVLEGEETELDRNIVEKLSDPLVHMIRNAIDHGLENSDDRAAHGKPELGKIRLTAAHQRGGIVIRIQDDGRGLDRSRILAKARDRGLVKTDANLTESEIFSLIFQPGFSTAEKVTDLSGRGVGMDVVRRNIENLRGKVEIQSLPGQGTTFTILLPLTLAIIDGLLVGVGGERYIIPTLSVRESFRPSPGTVKTVQGRGEVVSVRGRQTPLLRLAHYLGRTSRVIKPEDGIVVVVESGDSARGLLVDELLGKQEVVIKSSRPRFRPAKPAGRRGCSRRWLGRPYSRRGHIGPNALPPTAVYCPSFPCHAMSQKPSARTQPAAGEGRYLTFSLGDESYGLPVLNVREIIRLCPITPVPRMPPHVKGVINLRGTVIAVLDLRAKFQLTPKDYGERTCIIVVQVASPSGDSTLMGAVVDAVEEVVQLGAADIEATPDFGGAPETQYILGLATHPRRRQNPAQHREDFFRGRDPIAAART